MYDTLRTHRLGDYQVSIEARDQYNDYSVRFDFEINVIHVPTGKRRRFPAGFGERPGTRTLGAYDTARDWARRQA